MGSMLPAPCALDFCVLCSSCARVPRPVTYSSHHHVSGEHGLMRLRRTSSSCSRSALPKGWSHLPRSASTLRLLPILLPLPFSPSSCLFFSSPSSRPKFGPWLPGVSSGLLSNAQAASMMSIVHGACRVCKVDHGLVLSLRLGHDGEYDAAGPA